LRFNQGEKTKSDCKQEGSRNCSESKTALDSRYKIFSEKFRPIGATAKLNSEDRIKTMQIVQNSENKEEKFRSNLKTCFLVIQQSIFYNI